MGAGRGRQRRSATGAHVGAAKLRRALRLLAACYSNMGIALPTSDLANDLFNQGFLKVKRESISDTVCETVLTPEGRGVVDETLRGLWVTDEISEESLVGALAELQLGSGVSSHTYDTWRNQGVLDRINGEIELSRSSWELVQELIASEIAEPTVLAVSAEKLSF